MKKPITLMEGFLLMLIYFKLSNTGPAMTWLDIIVLVVVYWTVTIVEVLIKTTDLYKDFMDRIKYALDKFRFWLWKKKIARDVKRSATKASKTVMESYVNGRKQTSNPGQALDPKKTGKA